MTITQKAELLEVATELEHAAQRVRRTIADEPVEDPNERSSDDEPTITD